MEAHVNTSMMTMITVITTSPVRVKMVAPIGTDNAATETVVIATLLSVPKTMDARTMPCAVMEIVAASTNATKCVRKLQPASHVRMTTATAKTFSTLSWGITGSAATYGNRI